MEHRALDDESGSLVWGHLQYFGRPRCFTNVMEYTEGLECAQEENSRRRMLIACSFVFLHELGLACSRVCSCGCVRAFCLLCAVGKKRVICTAVKMSC